MSEHYEDGLRTLNRLWMISGKLKSPSSSLSSRTVLFESNGIPTLEEAEAALLHNWSSQPHTVELLSITATEQPHSIIQVDHEPSG